MAEVLELIRGRLHESEAVTVPIPVPRSKSNFLRVILKRLSGGLSRDAEGWTPTTRTGLAQHGWWSWWCRPRLLAFLSLAALHLLGLSLCVCVCACHLQADGFSMRLQQALGRARAVMSP